MTDEQQRAVAERRDASGQPVGMAGASDLHPIYPFGGAAGFLHGSRGTPLPMGESPEMNIPLVSIGMEPGS